jgi:hypothetical protein
MAVKKKEDVPLVYLWVYKKFCQIVNDKISFEDFNEAQTDSQDYCRNCEI